MEIQRYTALPDTALQIRMQVFVDEQGFENEVDETDAIAEHLVLFDGNQPIGTCRIFLSEDADTYILGRLCVIKPYRGKKCGTALIAAAEHRVRECGGKWLRLHSQCQAQRFYEQLGYMPYGEIEDEQGCPHIWVQKEIVL